uniref:hypothetical protein n=1 Tax=Acetatifactor sp. TaxID=1872090 RepID=UPI00405682CC
MTNASINEYLQGSNNGIIWDEELCKRIDNPKCIEKYGFKVYSQNDEDGIIEEIFNRIGVTNKKFIEFGVQDGIESNGHYLLLKGWSGLWIECDSDAVRKINDNFYHVIKNNKLTVAEEYITRENINAIFEQYQQTGEIDLLSIDIDGNDYHVWESINVVNPRAVVIEYNAKIPPSCEWVMPYCEEHMWDGGDKHGASLAALEKLGRKKGYVLVGTNISGVNAFFVREDCVKDNFANKAVRELYNPPRYYKKYYAGHPSLYCIQDLPEGRMQLFCGCDGNVLFRKGFHAKENPNTNMHWMAEKKAVLWIKDEHNSISQVKIKINNPVIGLNDASISKTIRFKAENGLWKEKELHNSEERIEIEVERQNCNNDGVLGVELEIESVWCPSELGMGEDNRKLGMLIVEVECF